MSVGPLLAVLRFLTCAAASMGSSDILFLLGLGLYLAIVFRFVTSTSEVDAVFEYMLEIVHFLPFYFLMVEQTYASECHVDAVFVAGHDHMVITNTATSLGDKLYTTLMGTLNIVAKGEECI